VPKVADICRTIIWVAVCLYAFLLPWGVSGVHIALGLGVLAWMVRSVAERKVTWLGKPVGWPVLAFVVILVAASLGVPKQWRGETMRELASFRTLLAIFLVASNIRVEARLKRFGLLLVGSLALFSAYASVARLVMLARGEALHFPLVVSESQLKRIERDVQERVEDYERKRAAGLEQEGTRPEALWLPDLGSMSEAGQLAIGLPFGLALLLATRDRKLRVALVLALALIALNLILNMKRGAWLACAVALLVLSLAEKRWIALAILAALAVAVALVPAARGRVLQSLAGDDGHRLKLWRAVPKVVRDFPYGVGPGCSDHAIKNKLLVPPDVREAMPDKDHFHSTIAELAVCATPLAVAAYLWWFGAFGVWAVRRLHRMTKDSASRAIVLGGLLAAVAFFVNGLVEYNLGDSDVTLMLYLAMGLAMAAAPTVVTRESERDRGDVAKAEM